jgi:predicted dehydrogenase/sugar lactone lactonase YvrE
MTNTEKTPEVRLAIIGCGDFGTYMAEIIAAMEDFRIVAVCDTDSDRARPLGEAYGVPAFDSFDDCLEKSGANAVALFTPNNLHHEQALAAAARGMHIFCEKPMALNVEQCYQMIEAAEKVGVCLMVGHKRRLRPQYAKMAEIVRSRALGRILTININGYFGRLAQGWWRKEACSGGLLSYAGVHDIDFLRHICGEVATVTARVPVKTDPHTDYEDAISLLLQFESGVAATLEVCPLYALQTFRQAFVVQIVFEHGSLWYNPHDFTLRVRDAAGNEDSFSFDNESGFLHAYTTELRSFARWVMLGETPVLTAWDGLRCVEIMQAARQSAYSGGEVALPLPKTCRSAVSKSGRPVRFAQALSMPEGPAFNREGTLYVANCRADYVSRIEQDGTIKTFVRTGGKTQGVAIHPDGRLFITDFLERKIFVATPDGRLCVHCDRYADGAPLRGPNEISFGPNGQLYFTDPGDAWRGIASGAVSRVTDAGTAEILADGFEFTNGLDFDPEGRMLYFVDTTKSRIFRAPLSPDGTLEIQPVEFIRFADNLRPDGIRFTADGKLYTTVFGAGRIAVVSPGGAIEQELCVPGLFPTNLIFRHGSMFVCEGQTGSIWRFDIDVRGCPTYAETVWGSC